MFVLTLNWFEEVWNLHKQQFLVKCYLLVCFPKGQPVNTEMFCVFRAKLPFKLISLEKKQSVIKNFSVGYVTMLCSKVRICVRACRE